MNPGTTAATTNAATPAAERSIVIRIKRQADPQKPSHWEEFRVPVRPNMNVISVLQWIAAHPVTVDGKATTTPVWDSGCLEEVCGICTMLVNGHVRQSCSALVKELEQPITLEPMTKFPVRRDLVIDRQRLFDHYRRVQAWIPIDGTYALGPGPRMDERDREEGYWLSRCMSCACCIEACPQVTPGQDEETGFMGAAPITWAPA